MQLSPEEFFELMNRIKKLEERVAALENAKPSIGSASVSHIRSVQEGNEKSKECSNLRPYRATLKFGPIFCSRRELIIKVIQFYLEKHPVETVEQFGECFPIDMQKTGGVTRIGTYVTDDEMKALSKYRYSDKENNASFDKYFFSKQHEWIVLGNGRIIYITKEWDKDAVEKNFIPNARRLGIEITIE